jgi:adenylate cyclase class 2
MNREIELKFRLADPAAFRTRLQAHGAQRVREDFEVNRVFDTEARAMTKSGGVLRVRELTTEGQPAQARLTYKGPREEHAVKIREEVETAVGSADSLCLILTRLGYTETIRYDKRRETWLLSDCEVVVDELPALGHFGEIEGPSINRVRNVQQKLEVSAADLVEDSYIGLTVQYGATGPDGVCHLSFAASAPGTPPRPIGPPWSSPEMHGE